jgi:hypothetical protein
MTTTYTTARAATGCSKIITAYIENQRHGHAQPPPPAT